MKNTNRKQPTQSESALAFGRPFLIASALLLAGSSTCAWADPQKPAINASQTFSTVATNSYNIDSITTLCYNSQQSESGELPAIVIEEQYAGALKATLGNNLIALLIDDGLQFDADTSPTITVKKADGTILPGRVDDTPFGALAFGETNGVVTQENRFFSFRLWYASDASTGPYTITISGLRVKTMASRTPMGNYNLTITGQSGLLPGGILSAEDLANGSNVGAKPTQQSLPVAPVLSCCFFPTLGFVISEGPLTEQKITARFSPPDDVQGKQGSVFILGYIPGSVTLAPDTYWMFDANRNWHIFNSCETAVAYHTGDLTALDNIPLVAEPTDITALIGTQLYFGYGVSDDLTSPAAACNDLLLNSLFAKIITVQE